jgi:hypothetical protein
MNAADRKLFIHSAHHSVGVVGDRSGLHRYSQGEAVGLSEAGGIVPIRAILVADDADAAARASRAAFQRSLERKVSLDCECADWSAVVLQFDEIRKADCVVLFWNGIHMGPPLAILRDIDRYREGTGMAVGGYREDAVFTEITTDGRAHPILSGVSSFGTHLSLTFDAMLSRDTTVLLATSDERARAVAWLEEGACGQTFHTLLGTPGDFLQPPFARLMLAALTWIGR